MSSRLPIISQDCQNCPFKSKCWDTSQDPRDEVLVLNLLVCRLKLGVKRDPTARLLLRMLQPKIEAIANFISRRCDVADRPELVAEIQSAIIEYLISEYKLGERAWPLHYLFAKPRGVITGWALKYIERRRAEQQRFANLSLTPDIEFEEAITELNAQITRGQIQSGPAALAPPEEPPEPPARTPIAAALSHVDDGLTLNAREYRVLQFCLRHAGDGETPVAGLHAYLATQLGLDRSTVSRVFRRACAKIIEVVGQMEIVLGVDLDREHNDQRRNRVLDIDRPPLTESEINGLLDLADAVGAPAACRAYGVHDKTLTVLRNRYRAAKTDARPTHRANYGNHGLPA